MALKKSNLIPGKKSEMTERQKRFCDEYLIDLNATRAARDAGYAAKDASTCAITVLRNVKVKAYIACEIRKRKYATDLKASDVLAEIRKLAFYDLSEAYEKDGSLKHPKKMPEDIRAALNTVETEELFAGRGRDRKKIGRTTKVKLADKVRALEMLAKHFKLLTDVQEHHGKDGNPIQVIVTLPANGSEVTEK